MTFKAGMLGLALAALGSGTGCTQSGRSPDVSVRIRTSLDQAGLKSVEVTQDRAKGVVTLTGNVAAEADKEQAGTIAKGLAGMQVVANEVAIVPPGGEDDAKRVNTALDKGIVHNLEAALVKEKMLAGVSYSANNHVVTLSGQVDSSDKRARAEQIALAVPNVQQVVNELQVTGQKASSAK